jgi:hypothetical protein
MEKLWPRKLELYLINTAQSSGPEITLAGSWLAFEPHRELTRTPLPPPASPTRSLIFIFQSTLSAFATNYIVLCFSTFAANLSAPTAGHVVISQAVLTTTVRFNSCQYRKICTKFRVPKHHILYVLAASEFWHKYLHLGMAVRIT